MTISSINSNIAALSAQQNIDAANTATATEVAQLSSGNRIVQASTDVAALSIGTSLASQVNTLNTSLTVASQGSSLLQVADGSLAQIQSILEQQQSIATQAQSGSLSSTQLGFLNEEFQQLTTQIDQLAQTTNFNGVSLINGSISGNAAITTNTNEGTTTTMTSSAAFSAAANASNNDTITINGYKVTFTTATAGTAAASGDVIVGTTAAATLQNLAQFLNNTHVAQLANIQFTASATTLSALYAGGSLAGTLTISSTSSTTGGISAVATDFTFGSTSVANTEIYQGVGVDRYSTSGTVTGSILVSQASGTSNYGVAVDVSNVANNTAFVGNFGGASIGQITGTFVTSSGGQVSLSLTVGGDTYTSGTVSLTGTSIQAITFTGANSQGQAKGGSFTLELQGDAFQSGSISSQTDVNNAVAQLNTALSGVTVNQNQTLTSFQAGDLVTTGVGTQVANLSGAQITYNGSNLSNLNISSLTITAPQNGGSDASIQAIINGQTYTSVSGIGNQIGTNTVIGLEDIDNPSNYLSIVTGNSGIASSSTTALDLSTQSNANLVATALQNALGLSNSNAALSFQVGSTTTDTIGVSIGSATSSTLFDGQTLDVSTQSDAATAYQAISTALNTVSALRANVGALETRFTYASNAITSAVQNEGAAQSTLLDTDVSATSTQFATSQVQLQAGIAVLAQANQLQQNLLKLIS
jgi:flagellin